MPNTQMCIQLVRQYLKWSRPYGFNCVTHLIFVYICVIMRCFYDYICEVCGILLLICFNVYRSSLFQRYKQGDILSRIANLYMSIPRYNFPQKKYNSTTSVNVSKCCFSKHWTFQFYNLVIRLLSFKNLQTTECRTSGFSYVQDAIYSKKFILSRLQSSTEHQF